MSRAPKPAVKIFEQHLGGHQLLTNSRHIRGSAWISFPRVLCHNWIKDNLVLIGDAAHTAHFSIGSGTKLGFEDAICLAQNMNSGKPVREALQAYQDERELEALKLQSAARNSMSWFENVPRYIDTFDMKQFTYSLLTRSQRVSHENLRLRDKVMAGSRSKKSWPAGHPANRSRTGARPCSPRSRLREMTLKNRVVVSPMSMYSAVEGVPSDWHLVHYGSLAMGGAGLVYTEMTDISPEGRITPGCAGIWNDEQEAAWKRIVDFVHNTRTPSFACSWATPDPKALPRWAGKQWTNRSMRATGKSSRRRPCHTALSIRYPGQ